MTNLAEAIQNACEIARQDERRKFKEYLEKKKEELSIPVMDKVSSKGYAHILNVATQRDIITKIINELFGGKL